MAHPHPHRTPHPNRPQPSTLSTLKSSAKNLLIAIHLHPGPPPLPLSTQIETATALKLTIETNPTPTTLTTCNPQPLSPFFATLPAELRTHIFAFALAPSPHPAPEYQHPPTSLNYRPELEAKPTTDTALLLTCRRVWLEANHLALQQAEPCFFFREFQSGTVDTRPGWAQRRRKGGEERFVFAGNARWGLVRRVRVFASVAWLEGTRGRGLEAGLRAWGVAAAEMEAGVEGLVGRERERELVLTVRHFDWWRWRVVRGIPDGGMDFAAEGTLGFSFGGLMGVLGRLRESGVRVLRLELETVVQKEGELEAIVARLRDAEDPAWVDSWVQNSREEMESRPLFGPQGWVLEPNVEESWWEGPAEGRWPNQADYVGLESLHYRVFTLVWKFHGPVWRPKPRTVAFDVDEREKERKTRATRERYERRWREQGSLLRLERDERPALRDMISVPHLNR